MSLSRTHRTADPVLGGTKLAAIVSIFFASFGGHVSFITYEFHVHAMMIQWRADTVLRYQAPNRPTDTAVTAAVALRVIARASYHYERPRGQWDLRREKSRGTAVLLQGDRPCAAVEPRIPIGEL